MRTKLPLLVASWFALGAMAADAWGPQGHRVTAAIAANHLTPVARQNVTWLLGKASLADVSVWADEYLQGNVQTATWHYINIPPDAAGYDRDRDCPRQPGVPAGARNDRWRDCVIDRILYNEERLADTTLDRADRAIALKFLVHFIGDLHQPFHALGVERGGNGIAVSLFGSTNCGSEERPSACNMHGVWDSGMIARRRLTDEEFVTHLTRVIARQRWSEMPAGTVVEWAIESHASARAALLPQGADVDERYYNAQLTVIDRRLALGGLRLAATLNRALKTPPPAQ